MSFPLSLPATSTPSWLGGASPQRPRARRGRGSREQASLALAGGSCVCSSLAAAAACPPAACDLAGRSPVAGRPLPTWLALSPGQGLPPSARHGAAARDSGQLPRRLRSRPAAGLVLPSGSESARTRFPGRRSRVDRVP